MSRKIYPKTRNLYTPNVDLYTGRIKGRMKGLSPFFTQSVTKNPQKSVSCPALTGLMLEICGYPPICNKKP